jgi:hypothetical protein
MFRVVSAEDVVVLKLGCEMFAITKPDGSNVMVFVWVTYPGADAVYCTLPVSPNA